MSGPDTVIRDNESRSSSPRHLLNFPEEASTPDPRLPVRLIPELSCWYGLIRDVGWFVQPANA